MNRVLISEEFVGKVCRAACIVGCTAVGCLQALPQTFLLDKYCVLLQMYKAGVAVPVRKDLLTLTDQVMVDCKIKERDAKLMKVFTVLGFDVFSAGSTKLTQGARIGIPYNFRYNGVDDVEVSLLKVGYEGRNLDVTSKSAKKLLSSLVLSDSSKRFAVAREVYSSTTSKFVICSFGSIFTLLTGYLIGSGLSLRFNFRQRLPRPVRLISYAASGAFGILTCVMVNDAVNTYYDNSADDKAASIGVDYAMGGVEYYEKVIARNKALRKLLGEDEGEKYYTKGGNFNTFLRFSTMPPSARLDRLRHKLKTYNTEQSNS